MRALIIGLLLALSAATAGARALHLDKRQYHALYYAHSIGGITEEAILYVESSFCEDDVGDHGLSIGCGQVQVRTAARVLHFRPSVQRLRYDQDFNIRVSYDYLRYCASRTHSYVRSVFCYQHGPAAAIRESCAEIEKSATLRRFWDRLNELALLQTVPVSGARLRDHLVGQRERPEPGKSAAACMRPGFVRAKISSIRWGNGAVRIGTRRRARSRSRA